MKDSFFYACGFICLQIKVTRILFLLGRDVFSSMFTKVKLHKLAV